MSNKLLQVHFDYQGPFDAEMTNQLFELAESINHEPGFIWKIWTESKKNQKAGGIYLFKNEETALAYIKKHAERLKAFGIEKVEFKIFDINEPLTQLNHGQV